MFPSSAFTSNDRWECGLTQSIFTTVPLTVTGCDASNSAANEWCATTGTAARSNPTEAARIAELFFISLPPANSRSSFISCQWGSAHPLNGLIRFSNGHEQLRFRDLSGVVRIVDGDD